MKALVFDGDLKISEVPEPNIVNGNDIKIKIYYAGICGTDIEKIRRTASKIEPLILGHEAIGEITSIGREVEKFSIGDLVVINPNEFCNTCDNCKKGIFYLCKGHGNGLEIAGLNKNGVFSEYFVTKEHLLEKVNSSIYGDKFENFLLVEPLACVLQGIDKLNLKKLKKVLVIGQGTIGYLASKVLLKLGHQVYSTDNNRNKIKLLSKTMPNCFSDINSLDETFDIIVDAVGNQFSLAYKFLKDDSEFLIFGQREDYKIDLNIKTFVLKNQKIIGSSEYTNHFNTAREYLENSLNIQEEVFKRYKFADYDSAFTAQNDFIKRMLIINEPM